MKHQDIGLKTGSAQGRRKLSRQEIQKRELSMLLFLDKFCRTHKIRYSLAGGSLLGAVRHGGFIPWDDDMDVSMPRPDYEKFLRLYQAESAQAAAKPGTAQSRFPYLLLSEKNPANDFPFSKLLDPETRIEFSYMQENADAHLWLDIFPIDGYPEKEAGIRRSVRLMRLLRFLLQLSRSKPFTGTTPLKKIGKTILYPLTHLLPTRFWKELMIRYARRRSFSTSKNVGAMTWGLYGTGECLPKNPRLIQMEFEGHKVLCTAVWDEYLTGIYGDYRTLPPEEEQVVHCMDVYLAEENNHDTQ